jgi:hypothetical protein
MPTFDLRSESHWTILLILLFAAAVDLLYAELGGNRSTMSRVVLDAEGYRPHVAFLFAYAAAVLVWHLDVPSYDPAPELWWALIKGAVVTLPILFVFVEVAVTPPQTDAGFLRRYAADDSGLILLCVAGTALGWLAAWWGVSQHVSA